MEKLFCHINYDGHVKRARIYPWWTDAMSNITILALEECHLSVLTDSSENQMLLSLV